MTNLKYPSDINVIWIATDRDGNVGAFIPSGVGAIPRLTLAIDRPHICDIARLIKELPVISKIRGLVPLSDPWYVHSAERGLFVFDWLDIYRNARLEPLSGGYDPVAVPLTPIRTRGLSNRLVSAIEGLELRAANFANESVIDIRKHVEWCDRERS